MKELPIKLPFTPAFCDFEGLLSHQAYAALRKIYQCVFMYGEDMYSSVPISKSMFLYWVGASKHTVDEAITELQRLNLIKTDSKTNKNVRYAINWEECKKLADSLGNVNAKGKYELQKLANKKQISILALPEEDLGRICTNHTLVQKMPKSDISAKNAPINEGLVQKMHQSEDISAKFAQTFEEATNGHDNISAKNAQIIVAEWAEKIISAIFAGKLPAPDGFKIMEAKTGDGLVQKMHQYLCRKCTNLELLVQNLPPYNNIEEKEEKKMSEARRDSYIEGEEQKTSEEAEKRSDVPSDSVFEDLDNSEDKPPVEEQEEDYDSEEAVARRSRERRERMKERSKKHKSSSSNPYINKPYFSKEELGAFTWNRELCVNSPVRLYLWNLFGGLLDYYEDNRYEGEDDDNSSSSPKQEASFADLDEMLISKKKLNNIASNALEDLKGQVGQGEYEIDGETVKINFTEIPEFNLYYLCDWGISESKEYITVHTDLFRNIEAEDIEDDVDDLPEQRRNLQYVAFLTQTDESILTQIERLQKRFLSCYVELNELFMVDYYKNRKGFRMENELTWQQIQPFILELGNIRKEQFFETLCQKEKYTTGMSLKKNGALFSYKRSQRINKLLGEQSQATVEKLTEILPTPY